MGIGRGEMSLDQAVFTLVFDHQRQMRRRVRARGIACAEWAEQDGERILAHRLEKDGAIGYPIELWCVHNDQKAEANATSKPRDSSELEHCGSKDIKIAAPPIDVNCGGRATACATVV